MKKFPLISAGILASGSVFAAVPTEVSTAMADAKADAVTVAGLALIAIVAIVAFKYMRKGL